MRRHLGRKSRPSGCHTDSDFVARIFIFRGGRGVPRTGNVHVHLVGCRVRRMAPPIVVSAVAVAVVTADSFRRRQVTTVVAAPTVPPVLFSVIAAAAAAARVTVSPAAVSSGPRRV